MRSASSVAKPSHAANGTAAAAAERSARAAVATWTALVTTIAPKTAALTASRFWRKNSSVHRIPMDELKVCYGSRPLEDRFEVDLFRGRGEVVGN